MDKLNPKFPYRIEKARWYLLFLWMEGILVDVEFDAANERLKVKMDQEEKYGTA